MTRDEVIKMVVEAGVDLMQPDGQYRSEYYACTPVELERLVQAAYNAGAAAEREECAKVCYADESKAWEWPGAARVGYYFAKVIRSRKGGA